MEKLLIVHSKEYQEIGLIKIVFFNLFFAVKFLILPHATFLKYEYIFIESMQKTFGLVPEDECIIKKYCC